MIICFVFVKNVTNVTENNFFIDDNKHTPILSESSSYFLANLNELYRIYC